MSDTCCHVLTRCLVTGGAGFVGSNLIKTLIDNKHVKAIVSLDNYTSGNTTNHVEGVEYIRGNTWDIMDVVRLTDFAPTVVFHFGEFSRIVQSFDNPELVFRSNLMGTALVIQYAVQKNAKLVYSGSTAIFGNGMVDQHLNPYAWTKAKNVELLSNMHNWYGLRYACCYFYNVFGAGQISSGPYATVIGIFEKQFRDGVPLTVVSPGTQTRAFTHIDDIIRGVMLVAEHGLGDDYTLGTTENISILDIARMFRGADIAFIPERRGERKSSCILYSRARKELGWSPVKRVENYIENVVDSACARSA